MCFHGTIKSISLTGGLILSTFFSFANAVETEFVDNVDVQDFFSNSGYKALKISPEGTFFIINADAGDRDNLLVLNRKSNKIISSFSVGENKRISDIHWVSDERFIFQARNKVGLYDDKEGPPNLYAANADGTNRKEIFTWGRAGFQLLNILPNDPEHILISRYFFADEGKPKSHLLNVYDGETNYLADQPEESQQLFADNSGNVRLSYHYNENEEHEFGKGVSTLYYKEKGREQWQKLELESFEPGDSLNFAGFSGDDRYAYFFSDMNSKVLEVYKFDTKTRDIEQLTKGSNVDVSNAVKGLNGSIVGFESFPGKVSRKYIGSSDSIKLLQAVGQAFAGQRVTITSATKDQSKAVIFVSSDQNPGEFYLFDTSTLEAKFIAARLSKLLPSELAEMNPVTFDARDGVKINGYLTLPSGAEQENFPLIVKVHGGPHGVRDYWGFDPENQYLAANGFAVLQVNFRGSGGYGKEFLESGYGEWGRKMQDDVTDATLWAIESGYADEDRICIYGGSYGGYSSLMGVIREPNLYQCAVGYVGVYSLPLMYEDGDIPDSDSGIKYLREVIGNDDSELRENSPVYQADKVEVPVFLVHGSEDVRVPMSHFEELTEAFDKHDVDYKTLVREEGHGFQKEENKFELYPKLIKFFEKHLD